jgi:hypothetical protein
MGGSDEARPFAGRSNRVRVSGDPARRRRSAQEVALAARDTERAQGCQLAGRLDSLGDDGGTELAPEGDDGARDRPLGGIMVDFARE